MGHPRTAGPSTARPPVPQKMRNGSASGRFAQDDTTKNKLREGGVDLFRVDAEFQEGLLGAVGVEFAFAGESR